jgi:HPt (histidine-containing phosphotransfer) domain-containing protein
MMAQSTKLDYSKKIPPRSSAEVLSELLAALEGDRQALEDLIGSFLASCQGHLQGISAAVHSENAQYLEKSAHHFKGSLGIFCQSEALAVTQRLIEMGEQNDLAQARQSLELLEQEVAALVLSLEDFMVR